MEREHASCMPLDAAIESVLFSVEGRGSLGEWRKLIYQVMVGQVSFSRWPASLLECGAFPPLLFFRAAREKQKRRKSAALQSGCRMCALAVNLFLPLDLLLEDGPGPMLNRGVSAWLNLSR